VTEKIPPWKNEGGVGDADCRRATPERDGSTLKSKEGGLNPALCFSSATRADLTVRHYGSTFDLFLRRF
jgi:hypothetical protein